MDTVTLPAILRARLSASGFLPLLPAESILFQAICTRGFADCSPGLKDDDLEPSSDKSWTRNQMIRGGFLEWLCVEILDGVQAAVPIVSVRGARFTENPVDLSELPRPLAISLLSCRFDYPVDVSESHFLTLELDRSWVPSLNARQTAFDKDLSMEGFQCAGVLVFEGATIGGDINGTKALFGQKRAACDPGPDERCNVIIRGANSCVLGSIFFDSCNVLGGVELTGAKISGDLDFQGSSLNGLGGSSLILEKVEIDGGLFVSAGFEATGQSRITNALIKNGIEANVAVFLLGGKRGSQPENAALRIENSLVEGSSSFGTGFRAEGLSLHNSEFGFVSLLGSVGEADLNLENTKMRQYTDVQKRWPLPGHLHIDGFIYDSIHDQADPHVIDVSRRLDWLQLDFGKSSQPFQQLARALREQGDEDGAIKVLQSMGGRLVENSPKWERLEDEVLEAPIGYGYSPQRSFWLLMGVAGLGWIIYRRNFIAGNMTPTESDAYQQFKSTKLIPPNYPRFSPLIYSIENTFPLVNLGQASKWQPDPNKSITESESIRSSCGERVERSPVARPRHKSRLLTGVPLFAANRATTRLRIFLWMQILVGWLLATLFVAGITGLIHK